MLASVFVWPSAVKRPQIAIHVRDAITRIQINNREDSEIIYMLQAGHQRRLVARWRQRSMIC